MGEIYSSASLGTIIWLGESRDGSDEAMRIVSLATNAVFTTNAVFNTYDPSSPSQNLDYLAKLLKRDWWGRMWVVQEVMLSPIAIMKCSAEEIPFDAFVEFRNLHWDAEQANIDRFQPLRNLWRDCPFAPRMWRNWRDWVGETLTSWMVNVAFFQCLHERDKIFALQGLVRPESQKLITVEYNTDVNTGGKKNRMVFLEAAAVCFHECGLLLLQQGQVEKRVDFSLPSWCPDWTSKQVFVPLLALDSQLTYTRLIFTHLLRNDYSPKSVTMMPSRAIPSPKIRISCSCMALLLI